jgi:hypothetical protein
LRTTLAPYSAHQHPGRRPHRQRAQFGLAARKSGAVSEAALLDTEAHVFNDANSVSTWHRLLPADRELLRLIVSGVTDLFSESSRGRLGAALGLNEAVTKNVPQQSLRRLQDADLVLRMD